MTARTITIPAPEWREDGMPGYFSLKIGEIVIASILRYPQRGYYAVVARRGPDERATLESLPSAKAWAEQRALELLGVKG